MRLLLLAAAAASGAWAQTPVLQNHAGIDWKVSSTLPGDPTSHEYVLIYEHKTTHAIETLVRFAKGFALPPHSHSSDETLVLLKGKLEVSIGGDRTVLKPGDYAVIPAGTVHSLKNVGWSRLEMVASFSGPLDFKRP